MATSYNKIRGKLKTGDIVLYAGKGNVSTLIKAVTVSRWSHVGMVFLVPQFDFVTVWESTTQSNVKDLVSGEIRKGVQFFPLSDRVRTYSGEIAVRRLKDVDMEEKLADLDALRMELRGRPYEQNYAELFKSAYNFLGSANEEDLSSIFCSELVAEAYQRLGLLENKKPSNEYVPADFSSSRELQFLNGKLGKEIELKWESEG